jgi:UDP-N-acetylmuramoyl-L-alanyl-D-glutamate--2,6-diaminopimelate ligase
VVGVTGTNGKTTVTTLVEGGLRALGWSVGRIGTTGNALDGVPRPTRFTTPEAPELQALLAEMRDEGARAVAMEVSSIGLAQHRVDGIPFAVAVFTNLTRDHLDFHGTMQAYADAKARLFRELLRPAGGAPRAVLCGDDPAHARMGAPADSWTYGFSEGLDLRIREAAFAASGIHLAVDTPDQVISLSSPMLGRHNALNLVAATAVLRCLGEDWSAAAEAVGSVPGVPGRLERVDDPRGRLIVVDYAHSPDALEHALCTLRELVTGQLWVVFGCGGDRDRGKRPQMGRVARAGADRVVVTSDNPRSEDPQQILDEIVSGIDDPEGLWVEVDRGEAIRAALSAAAPGDAVLIAGKGHETTQEIAGVKHPFDDRQVARLAVEAT